MVKEGREDLSAVFRALADPTRRQIVETLANEERTVGELAEPLEMSLPAVSKHLVILEKAGLLERRKEGRKHHLKFNAESLTTATDWLETQRRFWEGSLDKLADYLELPKKKS
ncbi:UNVERIFIED_CONTAM: hypothetical protein GTU68_018195 [Idotea baltica]|nr:hypothetical protein [Idotea baltica]